jgi:phytoene/squalene synthetase
MRLQWWRDVVENAASGAARAHEVAGPVHDLIRETGLPVAILDRLVAARRWDCWSEPFADATALDTYLDETGGALMWLAGRALDAPDSAEGTLRAYGRAAATASYLRAVPELHARGRHPLPEGLAPATLARRGLDWLAEARSSRGRVPPVVRPALLSGWQTAPLLRRFAAGAERAELPEFTRRGRLLWQAATGRW